MAPMFFRGLRGVNLSCTSPASTAICSNMEPPPSIYHHHHHHRSRPLSTIPFISQKPRKSSFEKPTRPISPTSSSRCLLDHDPSFYDVFPDLELDHVPDSIKNIDPSRFHFVEGEGSSDLKPKPANAYMRSSSSSAVMGSTWARFDSLDESDQVLRPNPSRFGEPQLQMGKREEGSSTSVVKSKVILNKSISSAALPKESSLKASTTSPARFHVAKEDDNTAALKSSSFSSRSRDQVVVLRVSLHCKGCEGKVRKHLSRMQGVTSFSIDFAAKKVTVIGDVTPLSVLSSISKVKNAQLWPSSSATVSKLP